MLRIAVPIVLLLAFSVVPAPAQGVNTITYALVVPCWDADGVSSGPLVTMPSGIYAITITGACDFGTHLAPGNSVPVNTPCSVPPVQNIPCISGASVDVPAAACLVSASVVWTYCGAQTGVLSCAQQHVVVNNQCFPLGTGLLAHGGGPVSARYVDSIYSDNVGAFVVTFQFTPLPI